MRARLTEVKLTTLGEIIRPSNNVTLIVGPNNVGKSAILNGLHQELIGDPNQPFGSATRLVDSAYLTLPQGTDYFNRLTSRARHYAPGTYPQGTYYQDTFVFPNGAAVGKPDIESALTRTTRFGQVANAFVSFLGPEGRGNVLSPQAVPDLLLSPARTPMQMLWESRALEATMSGYMQRAFGKRLTVNRHAGATIYLHIGQVITEEPQIGVESPYLEEVMRLPLLADQGAGMQAFMGTMLTLAAGSSDVVLLDEPEAFLHPPQARLLGEVVAELSRDGGPQVIAATHSDDFMQGVLNASRDDAAVSIARLTRPSDSENKFAQVEPDALKSLYRDPLLRYSNIIDGIFYKGVVLCESESDCTYYSATLDHIESAGKLPAADLLFTQCGGKDRLERAFNALAAASVPTAVIADIDLLADRVKFVSLFTSMGGDFSAIEATYNTLESSVRNRKVVPQREEARAEILRILDASEAATLEPEEVRQLNTLLRSESGWKQVKGKGEGAIDSGGPTAAFNGIIAACRTLGLFLVEVGELERFHPEISGTKQEWLRKVLEQELFKEASPARSFLSGVRDYVGHHQ